MKDRFIVRDLFIQVGAKPSTGLFLDPPPTPLTPITPIAHLALHEALFEGARRVVLEGLNDAPMASPPDAALERASQVVGRVAIGAAVQAAVLEHGMPTPDGPDLPPWISPWAHGQPTLQLHHLSMLRERLQHMLETVADVEQSFAATPEDVAAAADRLGRRPQDA